MVYTIGATRRLPPKSDASGRHRGRSDGRVDSVYQNNIGLGTTNRRDGIVANQGSPSRREQQRARQGPCWPHDVRAVRAAAQRTPRRGPKRACVRAQLNANATVLRKSSYSVFEEGQTGHGSGTECRAI